MADNYLESRMEAYRAGKLSARRQSSVRRAGTLSPGLHLTYPAMVILLLADDAANAEPYLEVFRHAGLSVCLQCRQGGAEAVGLAQRYGARLYPEDAEVPHMLDDICRTYKKEVSHIVCPGSFKTDGAISPAEAAKNTEPRSLARQLLFLLHPYNEILLHNQSLFHVGIG